MTDTIQDLLGWEPVPGARFGGATGPSWADGTVPFRAAGSARHRG